MGIRMCVFGGVTTDCSGFQSMQSSAREAQTRLTRCDERYKILSTLKQIRAFYVKRETNFSSYYHQRDQVYYIVTIDDGLPFGFGVAH